MKMRVIETNNGIQNEVTAERYDIFARSMRDRGWNGINSMISAGICGGDMLEIGPGPGYVGLEMAKKLTPKSFTGCEISPAMIKLAQKNAADYGINALYVKGSCMEMPFEDASFDSVISNGSLHEWESPLRVFNEIYRVLRLGGRYCITDLRRDAGFLAKCLGLSTTKPKSIRSGFLSSLYAAYTANEIKELLRNSDLNGAMITKDFFGLCIFGEKKKPASLSR